MDEKIINKIKIENADDIDMMYKILVSYLVSIGLIARIRGGGLWVNNQKVYSYSKALSILKAI
jgi:hypothetical protein